MCSYELSSKTFSIKKVYKKKKKLLLNWYHTTMFLHVQSTSLTLVLQIVVGRHGAVVRHLDPKVEQLEADVDVVEDDLSQLIDKVPGVNFPQSITLKLHQELRRRIANSKCELLFEYCRWYSYKL